MDPIFLRQTGALQNMKKLQLHSVRKRTERCEIPDGLQHHLLRLSGKPQYDMNDYGKSCILQAAVGILEHRETVPTVNTFRGFFMYGLKTELNPDRFPFVESLQHGYFVVPEAVRSCAD